ncbi:MAG: phosphoadenylyl-sulfate reductase [Steroidobacteraceae bacterium]
MGERAAAELHAKVTAVREVLCDAVAKYQRVTYANSLGAEAVVLTDLIASYAPEIEVFTIDTGRLNEETHELLGELQARYANRIRVVYPDAQSLQRLVTLQGLNGFYDSLEARLECCRVRKVEPFRRAITGFTAWITGIRRRQSADRANVGTVEWDGGHGLYQVRPLLEWNDEDIWGYVRAHGLPYNRLHDRGYPSIGCAPCTRAIHAGEDFRAGRWWWERTGSRECGLIRG